MIKILNDTIDSTYEFNQFTPNALEKEILNALIQSDELYEFDTPNQLKFQLNLRNNLVNAARDLDKSKFSFKVFRKSKCNEEYWHRTAEGGFMLQNNVKPSDAIKDIYINSSQYGTECATAMVIILYKALVDIFPEELFNKLFSEIYLMNWQQLDPDIGLRSYKDISDSIPGDLKYFKNPDVDPLTPEWQGENVIVLGKDYYYGHGIGNASSKTIIEKLNERRISDSMVSAYLTDSTKRMDFNYLEAKLAKFLKV